VRTPAKAAPCGFHCTHTSGSSVSLIGGLLPGVFRLASKIERSRRGEGTRAPARQLSTKAWLDIGRERNIAAENMMVRGLVPVEAVGEIQLTSQLRPCFRLERRTRLRFAPDARRDPVGTLTGDRAEDSHRAGHSPLP
jgi:hypothetical protein